MWSAIWRQPTITSSAATERWHHGKPLPYMVCNGSSHSGPVPPPWCLHQEAVIKQSTTQTCATKHLRAVEPLKNVVANRHQEIKFAEFSTPERAHFYRRPIELCLCKNEKGAKFFQNEGALIPGVINMVPISIYYIYPPLLPLCATRCSMYLLGSKSGWL